MNIKFKRNKMQKNYFELILTCYFVLKYDLSLYGRNILRWNEQTAS